MNDTPEVIIGDGRPEARMAVAGKTANLDGRFWRHPLAEEGQPCPEIHREQMAWAERLWACWRPLRVRDREHDQLYENRELRMLQVGGRSPTFQWLESIGFDVSDLFVTTGIVDTFQARLLRRKTMPMFVVDDAEWSLKSQAQEFRRWLHGKLRECHYEEIYSEILFDMLIRGDGLMYSDETDDDVFVERVHRSEILLDPHEVKMGPQAIRTMIRYRRVSRESLIEKFPEYRTQIEQCPEATSDTEWERGADLLANEREIGSRNVVDLVEAWHPPYCEPTPGEPCEGRKLVCIANATLCYEEWRDTDFPIARFKCFTARRGYWSVGVVERLRRVQMSINRMVRNLDMNVEVTGRGAWVVPEQFDIPVEKLSGARPFKLTYKGPRPPEFVSATPFSAQSFQYLQFKIDQAHNLVGSAQWSAQGRSPLGAGASGVAIDTMEDLLSDRHANLEEHAGLGRIASAQCLLSAAGRVAARMEEEEYEVEEEYEPTEDDEGYDLDIAEDGSAKRIRKVKKKRKKPYHAAYQDQSWMDKGVLELLDWHQVSMTRKQYRLQLEPVGFMPSTRAGKLAATAELIKNGVIQQNQAQDLYDEPDLAHLNRLTLAPQHNNQRMCELVGMLNKPLPRPSEYHDLAGLLAMCRQYYNRAENEMDPVKHAKERQAVLLRYMDFGDAIIALQDSMARAQAEKDAQMRRDAEASLAPAGGGAGMGGSAEAGPAMDMPMPPGLPPGPAPGMGDPGMPPPMMPPGPAAPPMA